jgi:hypothetical protein
LKSTIRPRVDDQDAVEQALHEGGARERHEVEQPKVEEAHEQEQPRQGEGRVQARRG